MVFDESRVSFTPTQPTDTGMVYAIIKVRVLLHGEFSGVLTDRATNAQIIWTYSPN